MRIEAQALRHADPKEQQVNHLHTSVLQIVQFKSAAGLGYLILQAEGTLDVAGVFAGIVVLAAFVILIDGLVTRVERRLLVWQPVAADTRT